MLLKYLKWRRSFVPNGSISESEITNEIAQNKMFVQGSDKNGQPILIVLAARHFQNNTGGLDEFKRESFVTKFILGNMKLFIITFLLQLREVSVTCVQVSWFTDSTKHVLGNSFPSSEIHFAVEKKLTETLIYQDSTRAGEVRCHW